MKALYLLGVTEALFLPLFDAVTFCGKVLPEYKRKILYLISYVFISLAIFGQLYWSHAKKCKPPYQYTTCGVALFPLYIVV